MKYLKNVPLSMFTQSCHPFVKIGNTDMIDPFEYVHYNRCCLVFTSVYAQEGNRIEFQDAIY